MTEERKEDIVNSPRHYIIGSIEVIDFIEQWLKHAPLDSYSGYLWASMFKYICRFPFKGKSVEDLKKAKWFLDRLIAEQDK